MLTVHVIIALAAIGIVAYRPARDASAALVAALAVLDVALGAPLLPALRSVTPVLAFLTAALALASAAERSGLVDRAAGTLARLAGGRSIVLFGLACGVCAVVTAVVSLDGAVVLMVPLLLTLARRYGAPFAPLLLGTVAVANAASIAVPQGNPTNLVLMEQLGLSPAAFLGHMLLPGLAAGAVCAAGAALLERRALALPYRPSVRDGGALSRTERHAAVALACAALAAWLSPLTGLAPWWPFVAVTAVALALHPAPRPRPVFPARLAAQVTGLLVVVGALNLAAPTLVAPGLAGLLLVTALVGAASALANNLPVSVSAAGLLAAGPLAYAAAVGLAVGSLATPQGSVATLLATDLAGPDAPPLGARQLAPLAVAGMLTATVALAALGA